MKELKEKFFQLHVNFNIYELKGFQAIQNAIFHIIYFKSYIIYLIRQWFYKKAHKRVVICLQETNYPGAGNFGKNYVVNVIYQILL